MSVKAMIAGGCVAWALIAGAVAIVIYRVELFGAPPIL